MRKFLMLLMLLAAVLTLTAAAGAEEETATFGKFSAPVTAESIDLGDVVVRDYDAFKAFLDKFPNLNRVDMFATEIRKANADALAERYPQIKFGWTLVVAASDHKHLIRTDTTAFSTLHNNKTRQHRSEDFSVLKYCTEMLALDVGHNSIDDLSFLYDLPNLRVLIIACNHVTDITPLASLHDLEYVEIFKNQITDITPLAGLTNLMDVNICFNRIKDWTPLYGLEKCRRLWLYNSNNYSDTNPVPTNVVTELREALPNAHIDSTHYSTLGGWREDPHYDVIFEMFKTSVYIPFAETAK